MLALELMVQIDIQGIQLRIGNGHLLRQNKNPARAQPPVDALHNVCSLRQRNELQREIQHHHRRIDNRDIRNVRLHQFHTRVVGITIDHRTAAIQHGRGIIHRDDAAVRCADVLPHGQRRRTQRTAEVVQIAPCRCVTTRQKAGHRHHRGIARHRATYHIGKDPRDLGIKAERVSLSQGVGKKGVSWLTHGSGLLL